MGQKTSPIGFRTGITLGWQSKWFAPKADYGNFLVEDQKIRRYIDNKHNRQMPKGAVAKIEIVRTRSEVKVTIEINEPELNATLVAESIAEQLCKRASFRRTMKQYCESAMNVGAKGVKIICSGRLAGAEMARKETQKLGSIPLHTLDANVDYATATARTTYGTIGIKVWIYKGKFGEEIDARRIRRRPPARRGGVGGRGGGRGGARAKKAAPGKKSKSDRKTNVKTPSPPAGDTNSKKQTGAEGS